MGSCACAGEGQSAINGRLLHHGFLRGGQVRAWRWTGRTGGGGRAMRPHDAGRGGETLTMPGGKIAAFANSVAALSFPRKNFRDVR